MDVPSIVKTTSILKSYGLQDEIITKIIHYCIHICVECYSTEQCIVCKECLSCCDMSGEHICRTCCGEKGWYLCAKHMNLENDILNIGCFWCRR